jgi:hypothetical protein
MDMVEYGYGEMWIWRNVDMMKCGYGEMWIW